MKRRTFLASLIGLCLAPLAKAKAVVSRKKSVEVAGVLLTPQEITVAEILQDIGFEPQHEDHAADAIAGLIEATKNWRVNLIRKHGEVHACRLTTRAFLSGALSYAHIYGQAMKRPLGPKLPDDHPWNEKRLDAMRKKLEGIRAASPNTSPTQSPPAPLPAQRS